MLHRWDDDVVGRDFGEEEGVTAIVGKADGNIGLAAAIANVKRLGLDVDLVSRGGEA